MENILRIILGLLLAGSSLGSIFAPDVIPVSESLPVKIALTVLGLWILSGVAKEQIQLVLRLAIGITFVYAAVDKVIHPDQFARIIYNYHILPGQFINIFALFLPWVELLAGVLVIVGYWEKAGALIIAGLLAVFIVALSIALMKGVNIECGCFSTTSKARGPIKDLILRDVLLLFACGILLAAKNSWLAIEGRRSLR